MKGSHLKVAARSHVSIASGIFACLIAGALPLSAQSLESIGKSQPPPGSEQLTDLSYIWPSGVTSDGSTLLGFHGGRVWKWQNGAYQYPEYGKVTGLPRMSDDGRAIIIGRGYPTYQDELIRDGAVVQTFAWPETIWDITPDGQTVVGWTHRSDEEGGPQPFRWTNGTYQNLQQLPESYWSDRLEGNMLASANPLIVSGNGSKRAYRWVNGVAQRLEPRSEDYYDWSEAHAISDDGKVIVGWRNEETGTIHGIRWVDGVARILQAPEGYDFAEALAVSGDGSVVVGRLAVHVVNRYEYTAFIWTEDTGVVKLLDHLQSKFGVDTTGWVLNTAEVITPDATVMYGKGRDPQGNSTLWRFENENPEAKVVMRRPEVNGLTASSILAGKSSIDEPLVFKASPADLEALPEVSKGLVADGVTPLLFEIVSPTRADASDNQPIEYNLELELVEGGTLDGAPVAERLRVAKDGQWTTATTITFTASDDKHYACFTPVLSDELQLAAPALQLTLRLHVVNPENGAKVGEQEFFLRKPPIALVHGYNTDGEWGDLFLGMLAISRPRFHEGEEDFIRTVKYGQVPAYAVNHQKENTILPFGPLATMLLRNLDHMKQGMQNDWALTRYDVVGHSQGGVLARILCSKNSNSHVTLPFRNEENFNRGRFHRVVTIGSPHNGTRIVRFMMALVEQYGPNLRSFSDLVSKSMITAGISQDKFDPNGEQIKLINREDAGAPWLPDPGAKFHLVQTTVNGGEPPSANSHSLADKSLGLHVAGHVVLPHGSDGVVDFDSMGATTPEAGQATPGNVYRVPANQQISHAYFEVPGKGGDLFAGDAGQVGAEFVGWHVIRVLDQDSIIPVEDRVFGPFRLPKPIPSIVLSNIRGAATAVKLGMEDAIRPVIDGEAASLRVMSDANTADVATTYTYEFHLPEGEELAGPVFWTVERYGIGGVELLSISSDPADGDPARVSVAIDQSIPGDVLLYGTATTMSGNVIIGAPALVFAGEPDPNEYYLASIEVSPDGGDFAASTAVQPHLWAIYRKNSSPNDEPLKMRRWMEPAEFELSSSAQGVVDVTEPLYWQFLSPGVATVSLEWRGHTAVTSFEVYDAAPGRHVDAFNSWAINLGLPDNGRGLTDRNGPLHIENLLAYALGINPFEATPSDLPELFRDPDQPQLLGFAYTRSKSAVEGVVYEIQESQIMDGWGPAVLASHGKIEESANDETWEATFDITTGIARFFRLHVTLQ